MNRHCETCGHNLVCFMRIQTARAAQSFKLLAMGPEEQARSGTTHHEGGLFAVLAGACTQWKGRQRDRD